MSVLGELEIKDMALRRRSALRMGTPTLRAEDNHLMWNRLRRIAGLWERRKPEARK